MVEVVRSRSNPLLVRLRRLARDGAAYRRDGEVWVEGEHLCAAALARGWPVARAVLAEAAFADLALRALGASAARTTVVADALFAELSALESPSRVGFVLALPPPQPLQATHDAVVLDRVQDAGNVGSILRSAAALGVRQVAAIKGTAALWSPKVLRAGMGAHFSLRLVEGLDAAEAAAGGLPLVATGSHGGVALPAARLPRPCAWVLGNEGQGVDAALLERAALVVRIPQPGGEESLNVAAAAAICLYEALRRS